MAEDYKWREITDLPQDLSTLTNHELEPLHRIWQEQKDSLADQRVIEEFNQQLKREWAIETGAIEGVYTLDRGVTQTLIEHGIKASVIPHQSGKMSPERVAMVIQAHAEVVDWLFDFVKGDRDLTTGYVKELHAALLRHQETFTAADPFGRLFETELHKGAYKTSPNNPRREDGSIYEYCPPEHVASEMDRLIAMHQEHIRLGIPIEVEAAWLHHWFTQIHPFEDGNGRVARAIASLVFIKARWFPLVIRSDEKSRYIDTLERADAGDLGPLVAEFAGVQRRVFLAAFDLANRTKPPETIDAAVTTARDLLIGMGKIVPKEWLAAKQTAQRLFGRTLTRLEHTKDRLDAEIGAMRPTFRFEVSQGDGYWSLQIPSIARRLHYSANPTEHNQLAWLTLTSARKAHIVVSFQGVGAIYRGILAVSVFLHVDGEEPLPACDEFFQINYREEHPQAEARFDPWLEKSIVRALALWQRSVISEFRP